MLPAPSRPPRARRTPAPARTATGAPQRPSGRAGALAATFLLGLASLLGAAPFASALGPTSVTIPGSHGTALGCESDWDPGCAAAEIVEDPESGLFTGTFDLPAGDYSYKVAHGGSWEENYGAGGAAGGEDITYSHDGGEISFWYDPNTHLATTTADGPLVTLPGSFSAALGCEEDWSPSCMRTLMQDPDRDGVFTWSTTALPTGRYEVKVAHDRSWDESYGEGGAAGGANMAFSTTSGKSVSFRYTLATHVLEITAEDPVTDGVGQQLGHFLDTGTLAWPADLAPDPASARFALLSAPDGGLSVVDGTVIGAEEIGQLTYDPDGLEPEQLENRAHLAGYRALHLEDLSREDLESALTGQLAIAQYDAQGNLRALSGVQIPGVLDDLYAEQARAGEDIGPRFVDGTPSLTLWAPTARSVSVQLFEPGAEDPEVLPMQRQDDGTWTIRGDASWEDREYLFAVEVYVPASDQVLTNVVTDPYATGLTVNSTRSVLVDLEDPRWAPEIWTQTDSPVVPQAVDQTIYELHVRDFSAGDESLPQELRGTYAAFGDERSTGSTRLQELSDAGMTTVHLLPTFDIASIEEDRSAQLVPDIDEDAGPASEQQQAAISDVADQDAYNWGYDPFHYMAPEGSYAREGHQSGGARTAEFRAMVGELHRMDLQVVLDQVYNHTAASGQADTSVLDKIVPGYYQRLNAKGAVETSTCCANLATEHAMAEQLMVDSTVLWARHYHVDGFRFDLMGHHSRANMEAVRAALDELTLAEDGVDGSAIYLYGEGWDFGEVAGNARFEQATQGQLDGTGIGSFNDRMRDAVHGGSPFDTDKRTHQGFGNGLFTMPNGHADVSQDEQLVDLRERTDLVRLGLAGNLADFSLRASDGEIRTGAELDYNGVPAGYASQPAESVNYVDAHDNESLYDMNVWKLPQDAPMDLRVRMNTLSLATTALGQSPSFWAGGTDLLRSKSLDRDSYNSGDYRNAIDWTGTSSGFGRGLPVQEKNGEAWPLMIPMLEDPALRPDPAAIAASEDRTLDLLRLRSSTGLFTLGDAELIQQKVTFPNAGPEATPGLLVMRIDDTLGTDVDPELDGVLVVFNASGEPITEQIDGLAGTPHELSAVQRDGSDEVVKTSRFDVADGTVTVPAATVAVFVAPTPTELEPPTEPTTDPASEAPEAPAAPQPETSTPALPSSDAPGEPSAGPGSPDAAGPSDPSGALPRTGIGAGGIALAATALIGAGLALRSRWGTSRA